jgi:Transposase DDE domain group 1/Oxidoreductase molybdopterin binding domain
VAVLLRPGKTPSGKEIRGHLRLLIRRIRRHWPQTRITIRGDSHYGRPEVMDWCDANDGSFILGLSGNAVLAAQVEVAADGVRTRRAIGDLDAVRDWTETRYGAKSWSGPRRVAARIEATRQGLDIRYVVTNIAGGTAWWLYECLYCARGQAENRIKLHKDVKPVNAAAWRLELSGLIADKRPWTLPQWQALPQSPMVIKHICVEGWSYIRGWSGVRLRVFLERVGADLRAKYVAFKTADDYPSSIDMATALHPQTLLSTQYGGDTPDPVWISRAPAHGGQTWIRRPRFG